MTARLSAFAPSLSTLVSASISIPAPHSRLAIRVPPRPHRHSSATSSADNSTVEKGHSANKGNSITPLSTHVGSIVVTADNTPRSVPTTLVPGPVNVVPPMASLVDGPKQMKSAAEKIAALPSLERPNSVPTKAVSSQPCSFRLSTSAAWTREASVSDAESDSESSDEPLKDTLKRLHNASVGSSASASRTSKRRRTSSTVDDAKNQRPQTVTLWKPDVSRPTLWYGSLNGSASARIPVSAPTPDVNNIAAEETPFSQLVKRQARAEPFLPQVHPPITSPQMRAERYDAVTAAAATEDAESNEPRAESELDSEDEVELCLRRPPRRAKAAHGRSTRSSGSEDTRPQVFLPRQPLSADKTVVMIEDVLYELPRARLIQNSEYFARQLAQAQDEGEQSVPLTRAPILKVTGVSAADFEALLAVCDDLG